MEKNKQRLSDGLVRQNIVLMSGIAITPVAACATDFEKSLSLSLGFTIIAFFSVLLCRFIPKRIVYTIRVIIYALIAGLVYIPAYFALNAVFGEAATAELGLYLPILAVNPLILTKTETRFCLRPPHLMTIELLGYIVGFDIVCILVGTLRDIMVNGRVGWMNLNAGFYIPAFETTFGGLIITGAAAGMCRAAYNSHKRKRTEKAEKEKQRQEFIKEVIQ
ncbi:MAG: NADH:ubiquinone oxidoreductase subunit RnfE [Oscillospiraceae bacterium]|jgi:electron transport complex protein RnfE|nr:NADH:ubiquinone oxidoreductase subunit RnfE [Oscillospiraceae bacterium]